MSPPMHQESPDPFFHPTSRTLMIRTSEQKSDSAAQGQEGLYVDLLVNIIRNGCIPTAVVIAVVTAVIHELSTAAQSQFPQRHQSSFSDCVLKMKIIYFN